MKEFENIYYFENDIVKFAFSKRVVDAKDIKSLSDVIVQYSFNIDKLTYAEQVHGTEVKVVTGTNCAIEKVDAIVTKEKNIPILIFTADCVPIIFYDNKQRVVGLAHAGWKGTYGNIVANVVKSMVMEYNCKVEDIRVVIGPHISGEEYEVSSELIDKFSTLNIANYFKEISGKYFLDLAVVNIELLKRAGILFENISNTGLCTIKNNDKFFSYRKDEQTTKRIGTIIELK